MTNKAWQTRKHNMLTKMIEECINFDYEKEAENNPKLKRVIELGRDKHLPLGEAIKIAEQEFPED